MDNILMDVRMPEMDGLTATKIREFNKNIPIIALSTNTFDEDVSKSIDAGHSYGHERSFIETP